MLINRVNKMCDSYKIEFGDKMCRSCLTHTEDMKSLNDPYSTEMCVAVVFTLITSLKCSEDNNVLPTHICHTCFGELHSSYQFVLKSRESDKKLQAYLNQIKNTQQEIVSENARNISGSTITDCTTRVTSENVTNLTATTLINSGQNKNAFIEAIHLDVTTEQNTLSNDLTLSNSDLSSENEITLEVYQSNGNIYEHSYKSITTLKAPLSMVEMQKDLDQELDLIKHEIDIKTEITNDKNYKDSIAANKESANEPDIVKGSESHLHSNQIANIIISDVTSDMENELDDYFITIDINKSTVFNRSNSETSIDIQQPSKQSLSNQTDHLLNSMTPCVVLERLNMNFTHSQYKQTKIVTSTEINKIPTVNNEMTSSDHLHVQVLPKIGRSLEIQDETENVCIDPAEKGYASAKSNLIVHTQRHIGEKLYSCKECLRTFTRKTSLVRHMRTHTGEKSYPCEVCSKSLNDKNNLLRHMRTHTGERPYSCNDCLKTFSDKSNLVSHMRLHTGGTLYSCKICSKAFKLNASLERHTRTHTGEKPYSCKICLKTFRDKPYLIRHTRMHTGEKPYSCKECSMTFSEKPNLLRHTRIHTGDKLYSCKICPKTFNVKGNLERHSRTHTEDKPYSCQICSKTFSAKPNLVRHSRTHTGEKPYVCTVCNKAYSQKQYLVHHTRNHIGEKSYSCTL